MHATVTATVAAPVAEVWAVLSDHEGMARWAPGMKASLVRPGEGERNGVGAVRRIQPAPLLAPFVEEVTAFEPEQRMAYRALSGVPLRNYHGSVELRPAGGGTEISYTISADNRIPGAAAVIARGLLFLFKRQVNRAG